MIDKSPNRSVINMRTESGLIPFTMPLRSIRFGNQHPFIKQNKSQESNKPNQSKWDKISIPYKNWLIKISSVHIVHSSIASFSTLFPHQLLRARKHTTIQYTKWMDCRKTHSHNTINKRPGNLAGIHSIRLHSLLPKNSQSVIST